jgi:hypothetical protein
MAKTNLHVKKDSVKFFKSRGSILITVKRVRDQHADFPSEESRRGTMPVQSSQRLPHPPSLTLFNSVYI